MNDKNLQYLNRMTPEFINQLIQLVKKAGQIILPYYRQPSEKINIAHKKDHTLLTQADISAHEILYDALKQLTPDIPILSEEGEIPSFLERSQWNCYWLIDPLDGTQGFIQGFEEFTVNVALVEHNQPICGFVYAPVFETCYYAVVGKGAWKLIKDGQPQKISTQPLNWQSFNMLMGKFVTTRGQGLIKLCHDFPGCHLTQLNSSLKFCWVAEGRGDIYPRLGSTCEWDTAAGQCILIEAGGALIDFNHNALQYNLKESLINPAFLAIGDISQIEAVLNLVK